MIKIEKVVLPSPEQWEAIIRGMRNPKNSWERSDTDWFMPNDETDAENYLAKGDDGLYMLLGENDLNLMNQLATGGPVHAKYRRMIPVYLDITAPLYWWKEFDTYKIGTVANSCSTMHKIHEKEFVWSDFSHEYLTDGAKRILKMTIDEMNCWRSRFLAWDDIDDENKERNGWHDKKDLWWQIIQLLPSSYNQKRTVMLNYEVLVGIYKWRKNHKLDEWREFCKWIESLPYSELITRAENKDALEHPVSPLLKPDNDLPIDNGMEFRPTRDDVTVCRCKDCEMFISIDKIKDDEEYGDLDTEPCIRLGLDGFCANTDTWACTDGYCSDAMRKEN